MRACGDVALPFVQPLFKEKDDRPLLAMAPELGHLKSPESADMLAKMTARPGPQLRLAVTRALVERKDDKGRAMRTTALDAIRKDGYASPELRAIVYAESTPDELLKQSPRSGRRARWRSRRCCARSGTPRRPTGWSASSTGCRPRRRSTCSRRGWPIHRPPRRPRLPPGKRSG